MANNGGIIPPDGRQPAAKGVGKNARRHDLEKPRGSVPGLAGSDLQYGDVGEMRQAQRRHPTGSTSKRIQAPATNQGSTGGSTPGSGPGGGGSSPSPGASVPDPIGFIAGRTGGRKTGPVQPAQAQRRLDMSGWTGLVQNIANSPTASGALRQAFLHQFSRLAARPYVPDVVMMNVQALDAGVEEGLNARN